MDEPPRDSSAAAGGVPGVPVVSQRLAVPPEDVGEDAAVLALVGLSPALPLLEQPIEFRVAGEREQTCLRRLGVAGAETDHARAPVHSIPGETLDLADAPPGAPREFDCGCQVVRRQPQ